MPVITSMICRSFLLCVVFHFLSALLLKCNSFNFNEVQFIGFFCAFGDISENPLPNSRS